MTHNIMTEEDWKKKKGKTNDAERQKLERQISWQQAKHLKLSNLTLAILIERSFDGSVFSTEGILVFAEIYGTPALN